VRGQSFLKYLTCFQSLNGQVGAASAPAQQLVAMDRRQGREFAIRMELAKIALGNHLNQKSVLLMSVQWVCK